MIHSFHATMTWFAGGVFASLLAVEPLVLDNGQIHLEVRADLGGKIISLRDASGVERLARSGKPYVERVAGMPYGDSEFDGIDEIFPNLTAGSITLADDRVVDLVDHGEVWTQAWRLRAAEDADQGLIALTATGTNLPYTFARQIRLSDNTVVLSYQVSNTGAVAFPYAYCFHPLFALVDGISVELPPDQPCDAPYAKGGILGPANVVHPWSWIQERLGPLATTNDRYWKVVARNCVTPVTIRWPDGGAVAMSWDTTVLPHAAFWCSEGGVAGLQHLACEPSVLRHDHLSDGIADGSARTLAPGEVHSWTIRLRLEPPPP